MVWRRIALLVVAVAAIVVVAPLAAQSQQAARVARVGVLPGGPVAPRAHQIDALREALRALGYTDGQNLVLEILARRATANPGRRSVHEP